MFSNGGLEPNDQNTPNDQKTLIDSEKNNYEKQSTLINQSTNHSTYGQRPVEFDALVPFMKVWRSNSAS